MSDTAPDGDHSLARPPLNADADADADADAHANAHSPSRPSSSSTQIAVDMHLTSEDHLYAVAEAMRGSTLVKTQSQSQTKTKPETKRKRRSATAEAPSLPPSASTSESSASADASGDNLANAPSSPSPSSSSSSSATASSDDSQQGSDPARGTAAEIGEAAACAFAFDTDMARYPASMTSSVRDHVYEGGLRYHAYRAGKYAFPNDDVEQNRDDMKHTMTLMLCRGAFFYAPVEGALERGGEVLDLGTGTGIWAMELGDKYPNSTITGIDLSPIQPTFVPENVHFFVDDFEEEWVDPENKYDFIHLRHTLHSVQDTPGLLRRAIRHLKPGGYFEAQEMVIIPESDDGSLTPETPYAFRDYINYMRAGMRAMGSDLHAILSLPEAMVAAGFEDVHKTTHKCPLGVWARDKRLRFCGLFLRTAIMDGLRGLSRRPLTALGWTPLQIEMFLVDVRKAIMEAGVHVYFTLQVIHGRKPLG